MLELLRAGEDQQTGSLAVKAMHDIYARARVLFFYVRAQDGERRRFAAARRSRYGQQTRLLVHHNQVVVLIDDAQFGMRELAVAAAGRDGHDVARLELKIMSRLYGIAYFDTPLT